MIHSISSHDLFGPSILTLLALHRCLGPSAPNLAQASPPRGPSVRSLDLPLAISPPWHMLLILVSLCGLIFCVSQHKRLLVHLSCHSITKTKQGPFNLP